MNIKVILVIESPFDFIQVPCSCIRKSRTFDVEVCGKGLFYRLKPQQHGARFCSCVMAISHATIIRLFPCLLWLFLCIRHQKHSKVKIDISKCPIAFRAFTIQSTTSRQNVCLLCLEHQHLKRLLQRRKLGKETKRLISPGALNTLRTRRRMFKLAFRSNFYNERSRPPDCSLVSPTKASLIAFYHSRNTRSTFARCETRSVRPFRRCREDRLEDQSEFRSERTRRKRSYDFRVINSARSHVFHPLRRVRNFVFELLGTSRQS